MANWFETKVTYDKLAENGTAVKKVTQSYLVDALSFTEAEARTIQERTPYMSGDFAVKAAKRTKIAEIFYSDNQDADKWYQVKWLITTLDEKPVAMGKPAIEKKVSVLTMVQATDFEAALKAFMEGMKNTLADFEIAAIAETAILEVYPAVLDKDEAKSE